MSIDTITLEILKNHARAAAESMAFTLYRTAHATFVKETEDFTTGLTTPAGETYATPIELGATWFVGTQLRTGHPRHPALRRGRHLHHQRSLLGVRVHALAGHPHLEADFP